MRSFFLALVLAISFSSPAFSAPGNYKKLKIGVALPLSGAAQFLGDYTLKGIELFLEGDPGLKENFELVVEDVTSSTAQGVSAVRKLLDVNEIDVLIIEMSPVTNAAAPFIESRKIPTLAIVGDDCATDKRYIVKFWMPAINEAKAVVEHIKEAKLFKLALVTTEQDAMLKRRDALKSLLDKSTIVFDKTVSSLEDLSILASQMVKESPDGLVMNLMPGQFGFLARRMREQGFKGEFIGNVVMDEENEYKLAQGVLEGAPFPYMKISEDFVVRYKKRYGMFPGIGAANGYDAMKIIAEAYESAGGAGVGFDRDTINQGLRVKNFSGAMGTYSFSFDERNTYDIPAIMDRVSLARYAREEAK